MHPVRHLATLNPMRVTLREIPADSVATLVYRALAVRGLRIGRNISVVSGSNDCASVAGLHPNPAADHPEFQ